MPRIRAGTKNNKENYIKSSESSMDTCKFHPREVERAERACDVQHSFNSERKSKFFFHVLATHHADSPFGACPIYSPVEHDSKLLPVQHSTVHNIARGVTERLPRLSKIVVKFPHSFPPIHREAAAHFLSDDNTNAVQHRQILVFHLHLLEPQRKRVQNHNG